jgi:hypothetical protein
VLLIAYMYLGAHLCTSEFTPYEFGCDELGGMFFNFSHQHAHISLLYPYIEAWIPMWALGRRFNRGRSLDRTVRVVLVFLTITVANLGCCYFIA